MGSDLSVVNAARVSFAKESDWLASAHDGHGNQVFKKELSVKDQKLIGYLAKHGHWTPYSHCFLSFRIKCPLFVRAQLIKHKIALRLGDEITSNEVSRRYVDDEPEFFFPKEWRGKPVNAKQGSDGVIDLDKEWDWEKHTVRPKTVVDAALTLYNTLLEMGVAPEQARMFLPQNTMTEFYWSGSLAAFGRVCKLRLDPHAQKETQEVVQMISDLVPSDFHHSWKALLG